MLFCFDVRQQGENKGEEQNENKEEEGEKEEEKKTDEPNVLQLFYLSLYLCFTCHIISISWPMKTIVCY